MIWNGLVLAMVVLTVCREFKVARLERGLMETRRDLASTKHHAEDLERTFRRQEEERLMKIHNKVRLGDLEGQTLRGGGKPSQIGASDAESPYAPLLGPQN
jgi:hypothetical protein